MKPRLSSLAPYLLQFRPFLGNVAGGLLLSVATLLGSVGLLGLSGGFLTATGLAGLVPATAQLFNVVIPAGGIRLFALVRTASRWSERVVNHEATFRLLGQLRVRLYKKLSRLSPRQLGLWHGAEVLNRLTRDVDLLDNLFIRLLVPIGASTILLGCLVALAWTLGPVLALPAAGLAVLGLVAVPTGLYLSSRKLSPRLVESQERLRRGLLDLVEGLEDWSLHQPAWVRQRSKVLEEDRTRLDTQTSLQRRGAGARALVITLIGLAVWATIGLVGSLPPGQEPDGPWFVALALLLLGTGEALLSLPAAWIELPGTARAAQRMTDLADTPPSPSFPDGQTAVPTTFDLVLEDIGFEYDPSQPLLHKISGRCRAADHVALVGPSGGGKTTLVRLLTRLEDPTEGRILLGGVDLREWTQTELRTKIACATQDPWIFTATIAENLRLAAPQATDVELWHVLELVGLAPQVQAWPTGLDTWVEEGGQSLSGGQRRRLALARVLLRNAQVTILDEPTEGLDAKAALALVRAVRGELQGRTLLWVTHRPQGLAEFPQVWTLANGTLGPTPG